MLWRMASLTGSWCNTSSCSFGKLRLKVLACSISEGTIRAKPTLKSDSKPPIIVVKLSQWRTPFPSSHCSASRSIRARPHRRPGGPVTIREKPFT